MKPIRIHYADDDKQAYDRHKQIQDRLEALGPEQVKQTEFPTQWNPIIGAWLNGEKLDEPEKD